MKRELEKISQIVMGCSACSAIMQFNGKPRFGFPPANDYVAMIVGAEPGPPAKGEMTHEQYREKFAPYASGKNKMQLLFKYIANAGADWTRIFYTNSVKCPPGVNPSEKLLRHCFLNCEKHLEAQIQAINPKIIVVVGKAVKRMGINNVTNGSMWKNIDNCLINLTEYNGIKTLAIRHPQGASVTCMETIALEICSLLNVIK